jgi:hypothetical protein
MKKNEFVRVLRRAARQMPWPYIRRRIIANVFAAWVFNVTLRFYWASADFSNGADIWWRFVAALCTASLWVIAFFWFERKTR